MDHAAMPSDPRWQALFADLGGQIEAGGSRGVGLELDDRIRHEMGQVVLADRLRGARSRVVRIGFTGRDRLVGLVGDVGPDWVLLCGEGTGYAPQEYVIPISAFAWVEGLGAAVSEP